MYVSIGRSEINRHEEITLRKMFDGCRSYTKLLSIRVDFPSANTHLQQKKNKRAMLITERTLKQPTKRYSADNSARGKIFGKLCDNATGNCREFQREKGEKERERERERKKEEMLLVSATQQGRNERLSSEDGKRISAAECSRTRVEFSWSFPRFLIPNQRGDRMRRTTGMGTGSAPSRMRALSPPSLLVPRETASPS